MLFSVIEESALAVCRYANQSLLRKTVAGLISNLTLPKGNLMRKFLTIVLVTLVAFTGAAYAAVNINTATQAELETLQGIGPAKAKAIIDHRKKNGSFKSADDLEKVNGIGPATLKRLRKDIAAGGATTVKKENKPAPK
jgi:competence protein ComEA